MSMPCAICWPCPAWKKRAVTRARNKASVAAMIVATAMSATHNVKGKARVKVAARINGNRVVRRNAVIVTACRAVKDRGKGKAVAGNRAAASLIHCRQH
jgi:hypothetical protein